MSEYQYYEFQAIDRPLTREEMSELRSCSSRARITSTRFTNVYHFGDFKGNRPEWMRRYFDAHLYDSNFGSRVFSLRFPTGWIDAATIMPYQVEGALEVAKTRTHLILSFILETEPDESGKRHWHAQRPSRTGFAERSQRGIPGETGGPHRTAPPQIGVHEEDTGSEIGLSVMDFYKPSVPGAAKGFRLPTTTMWRD